MTDTSTDLIEELIAGFQRERPDLDVEALALVCRFILVGRRMEQRAAAALKPFGLNYTDLDVLGTLRSEHPPHALSPAALMRNVLITSGAMTTCLDRLERVKMIKRTVDPNDRRARRVTLTDKGRALIDKALSPRVADAAESISALSPRERTTLHRLLKKVDLGEF